MVSPQNYFTCISFTKMEQLAKSVKAASFALQTLKTTEKNEILQSIHTEMQSRKEEILRQNELDLEVFYD